MRRKTLSLMVLLITFGISLVPLFTAHADGIIIPEPPICDPGPCPFPVPISQLAIEYHRVDVTIEDQVATTRVDQVFRNDNDWTVEGTYIFPLPENAAVTEFVLWIDGEPVEGEILTKEEARRTYEEIVRTMQDPALLEYIDHAAVQASIFPIPPGRSRRIELEYSEILTADSGLIYYRYPLNTEKFSTEPLEEVSVRVEVTSPQPVRTIYSPSHNVDISREGERSFVVGYEEADVKPDKDFELYYSISEDEIGLNLLTYRDPQGDESTGFFLLLAAPRVKTELQDTIEKDVILVLDKSGSMEGEKFTQAQDALRYVLDHLNPGDRFNIIAFSTSVKSYSDRLVPTDEVREAVRWVDGLAPAGSTDIQRSLQEALYITEEDRPTIIIFLTDGLPTEGMTDTDRIIESISRSAPKNVRLFAFGVGYDVDTILLDSLAQQNRGTTTYVTPGQAIDEAVSGFYAKVSLPVLTDIELDFGDIIVSDVYPEPLPDLFAGTQLAIVGRYRDSGTETIILSGEVDGQTQRFRYPEQRFRASGGADFLPRLWATRKIGYLLNQIRLHGAEQELVDQVVKLSIRYGIVTPYTSYLVTEPQTFGADAQEGIASEAFEELLNTVLPSVGEKAVGRAAAESEYRDAEIPLELDEETADIIRVVGSRTFRLSDGTWIDTAFDPDLMETLEVPFLSEDYFELSAVVPEIGDAFALGGSVIVVVDGTAYQVVGADERGDPIEIPEPAPVDEEPAVSILPVEPTPEEDEMADSPRTITLPCLGASFVVGLAVFPLFSNRRARKDN